MSRAVTVTFEMNHRRWSDRGQIRLQNRKLSERVGKLLAFSAGIENIHIWLLHTSEAATYKHELKI